MGASESSEEPQSVESQSLELLTFLFTMLVFILVSVFLIIEVILFFFPPKPAPAPQNALNMAALSTGQQPKSNGGSQPAFASFASWLTTIRTSNPPRGRGPPQPASS